jgi:hypothetical protein
LENMSWSFNVDVVRDSPNNNWWGLVLLNF